MTDLDKDMQVEIPVEPEQEPAQEPADQGKKPKKVKKKKTVWQEILSWVLTLLAAVAIALPVRALLFEPVRVDGRSMDHTLADGEVMIVTKPAVLMGKLKHGDIVICRFPKRVAWEKTIHLGAPLDLGLKSHVLFVKRLVGLPGDSVAVVDGHLYLNDQLVQEDYVTPSQFGGNYPRRTLGENEYFVLGDNRANSQDSRFYGPISRDMIVGHPKLVLLPLNKIRAL